METPPIKPPLAVSTWVAILAIVVVVGAMVVFATKQQNQGTNATPQPKNSSSSNSTIANQINNRNAAFRGSSTFGGISLENPADWKEASLTSATGSCRGYSSPERERYNREFQSTNPSVGDTDAVALYDVTVCSAGPLSTSIREFAEQWVLGSGASEIPAPKLDDPILGAIRYTLSLVRQFDVVFLHRSGIAVRVTIEQLPYAVPQNNQAKITELIRSIR
jgi:hypothetical protein